MYNLQNDSDKRLLSDPQDIGERHMDSDQEEEHGLEQYGLDQWRGMGRGYVGVPARADDEPIEYEAYRKRT